MRSEPSGLKQAYLRPERDEMDTLLLILLDGWLKWGKAQIEMEPNLSSDPQLMLLMEATQSLDSFSEAVRLIHTLPGPGADSTAPPGFEAGPLDPT